MPLTGRTGEHGSLRARLSSPSGFVSVGLALTLLIASVAVALGQGASKALLELGDGAVWLPTDPRGVVTLIDSTSGRPTAEIQVATGDGTELSVVYRDGKAYAYDASTGVLTLIDDASRSSSLAVDTGGDDGTTVLVGGGHTYVVDLEAGSVQVLDGQTLEPVGEPVELGGALGSVVVDGEGVLWAALRQGGRVVHADAEGTVGTLKVTDGATAPLTVVGGVVHALDVAAGTVRVLGIDSVTDGMPLSTARNADPAQLLVSAASDRDIAVLDPASCQVAVLAVQAGTSASVALPGETCGDDFGTPVVVDDLVFVPNYSTGGTLVLDITGKEAPTEVEVRADGPGQFDLFVDDGNVIANDPTSNEAVIFSGGTEAVDVTKFDEEVAENATRPEDTPAELPEPEPADQPDPDQPAAPEPQPTSAPEPTEEPTGEPTGAPTTAPTGTSTAPAPGVPDPTSTGGTPLPTGPSGTAPAPTTQPPSTTPPPVTTPPVTPPVVTPPVVTPPPVADPAQPRITGVSVGNHRNVVTFEPGAGGGPVASFALEVASGRGNPRVSQSGANQFTAVFGGCYVHTFVVVATGENGNASRSPASAEVPACPATPAPTGVQVTDRSQTAVAIAWDAVQGTGDVEYKVERGNGEVVRGWGGGTRATAEGLRPSTDYTLVVTARDDAGQSQPATIGVRTADPPPYAKDYTVVDGNLGGTCATPNKVGANFAGDGWADDARQCENNGGRWIAKDAAVTVRCASQNPSYPVLGDPKPNWTWHFRTRSGDWIRAAIINEKSGDQDYGAPAC